MQSSDIRSNMCSFVLICFDAWNVFTWGVRKELDVFSVHIIRSIVMHDRSDFLCVHFPKHVELILLMYMLLTRLCTTIGRRQEIAVLQ